MYHFENSDDDEKPKKRKKKKIPRLPNKVIVIKNRDKDVGNWMESWKSPKNRSPGHIPHPFRLLALGRPGRGKTNMLKQVFLQHQSAKNKFQKLIVVCCDESSQEWVDCEPTLITTELPDPEEFSGNEKTCMILDDYEHSGSNSEEARRLSTLMRFVSTHKNMSIMIGYQSFFDTPSIARKCANCFMLYKPSSKSELTVIANRVGVDAKKMKRLFKDKCNGDYDHLFVDKTIGIPYPLRRNIYELLTDDGNED